MLPQFTDRLNKERQQVFQQLKAFAKEFVLAGGTAIMLQIGRRVSYDFDCFCEQWKLPLNIMMKARKVFGSKIIVKLKTAEMISFSTETGIDVSFVCHPFKIIRPVIKTDTISLFHLDDLVASKAYTIGRRNTWRDYVDIFIFMKSKIYSLKKIVELADKKFGGEFNEKLFLGQLTYFKDIDVVHVDYLVQSYSEQEIKSFLEKEVESYVKTRI
ncbi:hypothetical protein CO165_03750 [Candidatus Roizmanbacteria bacterium CG_4_9_14_3_um_filter_33_18]|uniref:Nucleotidyl transferase AbiEii/AbiGii toxin family protein n=2 Tax=Candidatus Roizmaniibacteriota TaxID=1752723 RepID=A0A2M7XXF5_9BACT|nr:MAG: hypothetical protein COW97_03165 [Candidatus Roizmanbacteria bacterium CG22_combo_CG10-13_8_21_14_all_34_12]PJA55403.1 MAG: hypothetical protein CO165_03750 [Candidatus Roizmanbacteria bacterium CG_4_9_14_3_um_filter_33_18]